MSDSLVALVIFNLVISNLGNNINSSKNTSFLFKNNIITNSNISLPKINPQFYVHYGLTQSGWSTIGHIVEYVDPLLMRQYSGYSGICQNYNGVSMGQQFIDTDSFNFNEKLYQSFTLVEGVEYQLTFDWISQTPYIASNGINITWNGKMIDYFYNNQCTLTTSIYYVESINGTNTIAFQGLGIQDCFGIMIRNINLRQIIFSNNSSQIQQSIQNQSSVNDITEFINGTINQQLFEFVTSINANKISHLVTIISSLKQNAKFVMGLILEFNHFILYNSHLLNYTLTSEIIILGMQLIDDQKGEILDKYVYPFFKTSPQDILQDFSQQNNLPSNPNKIGSLLTFRPNGFLLDFADTVFMAVPVTLLIFLLGFLFFKVLFHFRISLIFRQYSILGLFFIILLDGRIQILTFQFLSEVLLLTTYYFEHKLKTIVIIFVYFLCFFLAVGSMLIYRLLYPKLLKYIYENCQPLIQSSFYMTFSYGIYNIILGALHRLLLQYPLYQLYALIAFEIIYLVYISTLLFLKFYQNNVLALTLCLMNTSRIAFVITLLAYQMEISSQEDIGSVQAYILYTFAGLWILSSIIFIFQKSRLFVRIISIECKKANKISPSKEVQIERVQNVYVLSKDRNNRTHIQIKYPAQTNYKFRQKCNKGAISSKDSRKKFTHYIIFKGKNGTNKYS